MKGSTPLALLALLSISLATTTITQAPSETTQPPSGTTQAPSGTTQAPSGTTQTPSGTTQAPSGTTQTPSGTTQAPSGTTQPPSGTTQAPSGTTQPPSGTTQAPSGTTQPPSGTTQAPSGTTQPPSGTTQAPSGTTQPPSGTTLAPSGTTQAPSGTTLAPSGTTQPPSGTTQPPSGTTQAPSGTTQPPSGTTQAPSGTTQPPSGTTQAPSGTTQPPSGTTQAPSGTIQAPSGTTLAPSGTTQAPSGTTQPPSGTTQAPSGTTQPPSGTTQAPSGTTQPPSGTTQAPSGTTQAPSGTTQAPSGTTQTPSGTTQAPSGTTQAPSGTTQSPSGTTQAPSGTTQAPSQTPSMNGSTPTQVTSSTPGPGNFCQKSPCGVDAACVELKNKRICLCVEGYYYNSSSSSCLKGKTFPGYVILKGVGTTNLDNKSSLAYENLHDEVTTFFENALTHSDYGQTVILKVSIVPSQSGRSEMRTDNKNVNVSVVNILRQSTNLSQIDITSRIMYAIPSSHIVTRYDAADQCEFYGCVKTNQDDCSNGLQCECKPELQRPNPQSSFCVALDCAQNCSEDLKKQCLKKDSGEFECMCQPGYREDGNNVCQKCPFGYSGMRCEDEFLLILTIVGTIAGIFILGLLIWLVYLGRSKNKKKNIEEQNLISNDFQNLQLQSTGFTNMGADGNMFPRVRTSPSRDFHAQNPYAN